MTIATGNRSEGQAVTRGPKELRTTKDTFMGHPSDSGAACGCVTTHGKWRASRSRSFHSYSGCCTYRWPVWIHSRAYMNENASARFLLVFNFNLQLSHKREPDMMIAGRPRVDSGHIHSWRGRRLGTCTFCPQAHVQRPHLCYAASRRHERDRGVDVRDFTLTIPLVSCVTTEFGRGCMMARCPPRRHTW